MKIELEQVGKKFNRQWLFKNISYSFTENKSYAIIGNNGSGKSTLLQMIYGYQTISSGKIHHRIKDQNIGSDKIHEYTSFVSPYLELPEELTLQEILQFHFKFKNKIDTINFEDIILKCGLENSRDKQIRFFSSGMKQRLKLALAFFSDTPLLLLDEPCSNLDTQGISWYQEMICEIRSNKTILIASNQIFEYDFCDGELSIADYKN